jgi:hypothetical protein
MQTFDYTLPAYCLSYLIKGDSSSLTDEEIAQIDSFVENLPKGTKVFSPGEITYFHWRNDLTGIIAGDVVDVEICIIQEKVDAIKES